MPAERIRYFIYYPQPSLLFLLPTFSFFSSTNLLILFFYQPSHSFLLPTFSFFSSPNLFILSFSQPSPSFHLTFSPTPHSFLLRTFLFFLSFLLQTFLFFPSLNLFLSHFLILSFSRFTFFFLFPTSYASLPPLTRPNN